MKINAPRGTADILPAESWKWQAVERIARQTAELYHFAEIRTPIFEHDELFHRGMGETSDVVTKETYTFKDRGERLITLRPEGTAGVVRAMIEHNLLAQEGARQKVYYIGPNFRYEKPQAGRLRQHNQFGVEAFGVAEPEQDVECILLQMDFYRRCGLRNLNLRINSLGDAESKAIYSEELRKFFGAKGSLSEDSQRRLETNPLRILDSKDPRDRDACQGVPPAYAFLSPKSKSHFDKVEKLLDDAKVDYWFEGKMVSPTHGDLVGDGHSRWFNRDQKLVRGFDYYTETLWEVTAGGLGAQDAVGGGGRYDNLVEQLGGRLTPGVGFGSGLERLLLALESQKVNLSDAPPERLKLIWLVAQNEDAVKYNRELIAELRRYGYVCDMDLSNRSMKAQFKMADREAATICLIVGENELKTNQVMVKEMWNGRQTTVDRSKLLEQLKDWVEPLYPQAIVFALPTDSLP